jgi:hypothetical protein
MTKLKKKKSSCLFPYSERTIATTETIAQMKALTLKDIQKYSYTANVYRQMTDELMFKSVISTQR